MLQMNTLAKILIIVGVVFAIITFILKGLNLLDITADDIKKITLVIISPELLVGINKGLDKFRKNDK